jgi:ATP-binding cassette subfamily B protein
MVVKINCQNILQSKKKKTDICNKFENIFRIIFMLFNTFPHEYQMDAKDCGPACLKIIAKYYGKYYSLQYLRNLCGITREGVSLLDISYAGEKVGLRSISIQVTLQNLIEQVPLPAIVHWNNDHFIVVYKVTKTKIYVSDSAKGLLSYTHAQFKEKWYKENEDYGVLMALEPMANFKQMEAHERIERLKNFENLLGYFTPYKKAFGILFFIMLIATVLQAFLPFISKAVIDTGIHTGDITFINYGADSQYRFIAEHHAFQYLARLGAVACYYPCKYLAFIGLSD